LDLVINAQSERLCSCSLCGSRVRTDGAVDRFA
jgi:hypothetical protein